jgi:hypothetical protein
MSEDPGNWSTHGAGHQISNLFVCDMGAFTTSLGAAAIHTAALGDRTAHYISDAGGVIMTEGGVSGRGRTRASAPSGVRRRQRE